VASVTCCCPTFASLVLNTTEDYPIDFGLFHETGSFPVDFGNYRLESVISNGNSIVFKAMQKDPERQVALKIPKMGLLSSELSRERFRMEYALAAGLRHPAIIPVFEVGNCDGVPYYTMPFVEGHTLLDYASEKNISTREKIQLFTRICEVVAVLHRADLIHRDLKSENLMIDEFGEVALLDFGLAVQFVGNGDKKGTHFNAGTIRYMPPEQAAGTQIDRLGFQADVFSLGVIGYRLFTGEFPFDLPESKALALKRVKDCPVQFDILESCNVPQSVKLAIRTALQKDPNERPVQAQAFLDILKGKYPGNMPAGFYSMFLKRRIWKTRGARILLTACGAGLCYWGWISLSLR